MRKVRRSGPVIVARIQREKGKKEIMKNKYKQKGERIFIENDLTYEERKVQEKMGRWAKEKRVGGVEVKIGRGRVKIGNRWITWEEIEREERGREEEGRRGREGRIEILHRPRRERKRGERRRNKREGREREKGLILERGRVGKKRRRVLGLRKGK